MHCHYYYYFSKQQSSYFYNSFTGEAQSIDTVTKSDDCYKMKQEGYMADWDWLPNHVSIHHLSCYYLLLIIYSIE